MIEKFILKNLIKYTSHWIVLGIDLLLVSLSYLLAYFIRFSDSFQYETYGLIYQIPTIFVLALLSFLTIGSHKGVIRHTGIRDIYNIVIAVSLLSTVCLLFVFANRFFGLLPEVTIPISIIIIHSFVSAFVLIISRFSFKSVFEFIQSDTETVTNVLLYGAGSSGMMIFDALNKDLKYNFKVLGFIDDDKNKINKKINCTPIFSLDQITQEFKTQENLHEVIISAQKLDSERLLEITNYFLSFGIRVKKVPSFSTWINGTFNVNQIKDVQIEDLLGRPIICINNPVLHESLKNKVILVTGAAGSIGSEISRQLATYNCKHLILVDQAESALFELQQELLQNGISHFTAIVADVRDFQRMELLFREFLPQKVFHASAYKHVPLMEENPYEAIKTNVQGTKNIADISLIYDVERFVLVSSDKAVNPTNVMGATKRVAEKYITCLSKFNSTTKFTITRFGNVLGSNGSVIPMFKKQIKKGGPLTVTHKEITRYFMTIPEACCLVLEAGAMGIGGEIYIFDMGKSIKIFDLAKKMIQFSGHVYPQDIDIKIIGLRPGEKLFEELLTSNENTLPTYHKKIMIAKTKNLLVEETLEAINSLCKENMHIDHQNSVLLLKSLVPEYRSKNSIYEKLDKPLEIKRIKNKVYSEANLNNLL